MGGGGIYCFYFLSDPSDSGDFHPLDIPQTRTLNQRLDFGRVFDVLVKRMTDRPTNLLLTRKLLIRPVGINGTISILLFSLLEPFIVGTSYLCHTVMVDLSYAVKLFKSMVQLAFLLDVSNAQGWVSDIGERGKPHIMTSSMLIFQTFTLVDLHLKGRQEFTWDGRSALLSSLFHSTKKNPVWMSHNMNRKRKNRTLFTGVFSTRNEGRERQRRGRKRSSARHILRKKG